MLTTTRGREPKPLHPPGPLPHSHNTIAAMLADSRCVVYEDVGSARRLWIKGEFLEPRSKSWFLSGRKALGRDGARGAG